MSTTNITSAAAAYRDASKIAERILQETGANKVSESKPAQASFSTLIGESLRKAAATGYNSEAVATRALAGKADVTDVVTAVADAELSLNTVIAVRDRVISAYQDIIKMPI
jgi:flagellar hook-basal body complex protein FliE